MFTRSFHRRLLIVALSGWVAFSVHAAPASGNEEWVPPLTERTVARLSGLDPQTLRAAGVSAEQRQQIADHLQAFFTRQRPRLMTHRAIWLEMRERAGNLASSAERNVFDPCEFVTDEALEKARAQTREARDRFRAACRRANERVEQMVTPERFRLIENAGNNPALPAPYHWLALDEAQRRNIERVVRVHRARRQLALKYPHLKEKFNEQNRDRAIAQLLPENQQQRLASLRERLDQLDQPQNEQP